ncbi:MAG TPA: c-type cytochrome [Gemmatimonadaceae bacterium]|nr:c-type cytochrome [Gemmatimonadaceae bacterium]
MTRYVMAFVLFAAGTAAAQFPPQRATNLKVLPTTIPMDSLVDTMAGFTRALGVRCNYCHVGADGAGLETYDFANDQKATKEKARVMLRMVASINEDHLAKLAMRRTPPIAVTCATCHHGIAQPRPLQQVLLGAYDAGGFDSLSSAYRALRTRYYGAAAYDFGEVPLADVGSAIGRRGNLPDALRTHLLNVEVTPASTFALRQAAGTQLALGDTAAAITSYERAVALNPNDGQSKRALETLRKKP